MDSEPGLKTFEELADFAAKKWGKLPQAVREAINPRVGVIRSVDVVGKGRARGTKALYPADSFERLETYWTLQRSYRGDVLDFILWRKGLKSWDEQVARYVADCVNYATAIARTVVPPRSQASFLANPDTFTALRELIGGGLPPRKAKGLIALFLSPNVRDVLPSIPEERVQTMGDTVLALLPVLKNEETIPKTVSPTLSDELLERVPSEQKDWSEQLLASMLFHFSVDASKHSWSDVVRQIVRSKVSTWNTDALRQVFGEFFSDPEVAGAMREAERFMSEATAILIPKKQQHSAEPPGGYAIWLQGVISALVIASLYYWRRATVSPPAPRQSPRRP